MELVKVKVKNLPGKMWIFRNLSIETKKAEKYLQLQVKVVH